MGKEIINSLPVLTCFAAFGHSFCGMQAFIFQLSIQICVSI